MELICFSFFQLGKREYFRCLNLWIRELVKSYLVPPNIDLKNLANEVGGFNESGEKVSTNVILEKPITVFLNDLEIITSMTIGDYPELLALGFLFNQRIIKEKKEVRSVEFDKDLSVVVVRTYEDTNYEINSRKKIRTSGCAVGTVFEDLMDEVDQLKLKTTSLPVSLVYSLSKRINTTPSLYLETGAIHGTVLCNFRDPLVYMEDVGRHNAVDKVAGWMLDNKVVGSDKILYTTGRLTSEMVIKTAVMGIPILLSRSGFTAWGVELAESVGLTMIGRLRGHRFLCLTGADNIIFDEK